MAPFAETPRFIRANIYFHLRRHSSACLFLAFFKFLYDIFQVDLAFFKKNIRLCENIVMILRPEQPDNHAKFAASVYTRRIVLATRATPSTSSSD